MKGQISFEFLVAFLFLVLSFLVSMAIYQDESQNANLFLATMSAQYVASDFSQAINGVYQCGNGCSYTLQLENGYSLSIRGRLLEVPGGPNFGQADLVTDNVTLQSATPGQYIKVVNNNGVIELYDA